MSDKNESAPESVGTVGAHTPGPWATVERYLDCLSVVDAGGFEHLTAESHAILLGYTEILGVDHWSGVDGAARDISPEEQFANARLIAAAPDLLAALRSLIGCIGPEGYFPQAGLTITKAARAAVRKAEGR